MKLISSLVNVTLLKNNTKRFWVLSLFYFLFTFLLGPFIFLMNKSSGVITSVNEYTYEWFREILHFQSTGFWFLFFTIIYAFILGIALNSQMTEKGQMVFVHSLPSTKLCNYLTSFVSMITLIFVPVFVNCCLMAFLKLVFGFSAYRYVHVLYFMYELAVAMILVYTFTALIGTLCGTKLFAGMLTIFFGTLPMLLYLSWMGIGSWFIPGFTFDTTGLDAIINISPLAKVWVLSEKPFTLVSSLIYLLVSAGFIACGYYIYKIRKNEKATEPLAFETPKVILKYLITALVVYPMAIAFSEMTSYSRTATYIGAIFGIFVGYFVTEMFIQKNLNVWNKWKGFVLSIIAFALVVVVLKTGSFGFESYIPDEDDIEAVVVADNPYQYDVFYSNEYDFLGHKKTEKKLSDKFSSDEEYIKLTREYHQELINSDISYFLYQRQLNKHDYNHIYISKELKPVKFERELISYRLKNGKIVQREYYHNVYDNKDSESKVKSCDAYKRINYKEMFDLIEGKTKDTLIGFTLVNEIFGYDKQLYVTDENVIKELIAAIMKDYMNSTYDAVNLEQVLTVNVEYIPFSEFNKNEHVMKDVMFQGNATKESSVFVDLPCIDSTFENFFNVLKKYGWYEMVVPCNSNTSEFRLYKINSGDLQEEYNNGFSIGPTSWRKCIAGTSIDENVLSKYSYVLVDNDYDMLKMTSLQNDFSFENTTAGKNSETAAYLSNNYTYIAYMILDPSFASGSTGYTELFRVSESLVPERYISELDK